jgi:hypothetical protein
MNCPKCRKKNAEIRRLKAFANQIAQRLYLCAEVLSIKAEKQKRRNAQP